MSNIFCDVLSLAPLNTTHWHIQDNRFVRMGCAVVDGYLNLSILRSIKSREYAKGVYAGQIYDVLSKCPEGANAYSFSSGKFFQVNEQLIKIITAEEHKPILNAADLKDLVFIEHLTDRIEDFKQENKCIKFIS